jgi:hypothetical protein
MLKNIIGLLAALSVTIMAQNTWACSLPTGSTKADWWVDGLATQKNFMFVGSVIDILTTETSHNKKCLIVSFSVSEIIFGKNPDFVGFTYCEEKSEESFIQAKAFIENYGIKIGASMVVGLTYNSRPEDGVGFTSELRPMIAGCYPFIVSTEDMSTKDRVDFLSNLKSDIDEAKPN